MQALPAESMHSAAVLNLDLPDPEREDISKLEFLAQLERAWDVCDRFDLQTEIWRGRILRSVRDREKRGGDGPGSGFIQWLREREISKSRAYSLIQLADSADNLVEEGSLEADCVNNFSKRAFLEAAQADPEVQLLVSEAANSGRKITRQQVRRLHDEFLAATSPLLPDEVRRRTQENLLPPKLVAPLVREMAKLDDEQQEELCRDLRETPDVDTIKEATSAARWLAKAREAGLAVRALQRDDLELDKVLQEAQRLNALGLVADVLHQSHLLEQSVLRLYASWSRLCDLHERLWLESGSSTPHLRILLDAIGTLAGATLRVSLGELSGGKRLRLQIVEDSPERPDPPATHQTCPAVETADLAVTS